MVELTSPSNPNGAFEALTSPQSPELVGDTKERLITAIADVIAFAIENVQVDPEMAELIAIRAAQEMVHALHPNLNQDKLDEIMREACAKAEAFRVDRAINNILPNE